MAWTWRRVSGASFAVAAAAMVVTPLRPRGRRAVLADVVVAGLAGSTAATAIGTWGSLRAMVGMATIAKGSWLVELAGSRTGVPFGDYRYTSALQPQAAGVPVAVPLAWYAMSLPARETAHAILGPRSTPAARIALGAASLAAWDLFLDPQMTAERYWVWPRGGAYRGVPVTNFAGWLVTGVLVMAALEGLHPVGDPVPGAVGVYGWMAVMHTVGVAAFFREPLVAAVGGTMMLPLAALALRRLALRRLALRRLALRQQAQPGGRCG